MGRRRSSQYGLISTDYLLTHSRLRAALLLLLLGRAVGDVMVDVFRRVIRVGGTVHLAALNSMYQPITDFEILGIYSYAVSGFNLTA